MSDTHTSLVGRTLSHYEIVEEIGRGGMGVVYRARDTELRRDVAFKVLPEAFVADKDRLSRFEREARVLAALNHPGIATIHELGREGSTHFLVMELVPGDDLAKRLSRGAMSLDEVLKLFPRIAEALEAAHGQGVVHRDLKPANVRVTPEGRVKLLDFGLAKPVETSAEQDPSLSPTLTREGTATGVILGTASYMSPEQALGKTVDKRADVWAFGCVLYEALSGQKAFPGQTVVETLAAVLRKEPDWGALPSDTPPALRTLVKRCLRVDPDRRLHDVADARIVLEDVTSAPEELLPQTKRRFPWAAVAAIAIAGLAVLIAREWGEYFSPPPVMRMSILAPEGTEFPRLAVPAVSPDGTRIAFVTRGEDGVQHLWVRALDRFEARRLPGTEDANLPFWSPDGREIGFFGGGKLKTIDAEGGEPRSLADTDLARGGWWGEDGTILYTPTRSSPVFAVSARGGPPRQVTELGPGELSHRHPQFLPDGRRFLYRCSGCSPGGTLVGSLDSDAPHPFLRLSSLGRFVSGHLVFFSEEGWLVAQTFDPDEAKLLGEPVALTENPQVDWREGLFSISENGVLVYPRETPFTRQLVLYDRSGKWLETIGSPGSYGSPQFSPDGTRMAFHDLPEQIWIHELETASSRSVGRGRAPVWSPDGSEIMMHGEGGIHRARVDTGDAGKLILTAQALNTFPTDWSGRHLVFFRQNDERTRNLDLWAVPVLDDGVGEPFPIVRSEGGDGPGRVSPDGEWLAYGSSRGEAGYQIYVQRFPHATEWIQVSQSGGFQPAWGRDGRELYYMNPTGAVMVVDVELGREIRLGTPRELFHTKVDVDAFVTMRNSFDAAPDGERFVVLEPSADAAVHELHIIVNWRSLLSERGR